MEIESRIRGCLLGGVTELDRRQRIYNRFGLFELSREVGYLS